MIKKDELLFIVDELNNPIEPKPRNDVHSKGIWHRTTQIWIINDKKQILCQRRSLLKDTNPGKWEAFFGGHLAPKQEYLDCASQELAEELGITVPKNELHFFQVHKFPPDKEFQGVFYTRWNGDASSLQLEEEEVDQVKWVDLLKIRELIVEKKDDNWTKWGYERELLKELVHLR